MAVPGCPVALTANAFKNDLDRCLAVGMDAHLAKAYSTRQFRANEPITATLTATWQRILSGVHTCATRIGAAGLRVCRQSIELKPHALYAQEG
jgi:hypothetical protein